MVDPLGCSVRLLQKTDIDKKSLTDLVGRFLILVVFGIPEKQISPCKDYKCGGYLFSTPSDALTEHRLFFCFRGGILLFSVL